MEELSILRLQFENQRQDLLNYREEEAEKLEEWKKQYEEETKVREERENQLKEERAELRNLEKELKEEKENSKVSLLTKYGNMMKNVIPKMPGSEEDLPVYLDTIDGLFRTYEVP